MPSLFDQSLQKLNENKGLLSAVLASGAGAAALGGYAASKVHPSGKGPLGHEAPSARRKRILKNALGVGALGAGSVGLLGAGMGSFDQAKPEPSPTPTSDKIVDALQGAVFNNWTAQNLAVPASAAYIAHNIPGRTTRGALDTGTTSLLEEMNARAKAHATEQTKKSGVPLPKGKGAILKGSGPLSPSAWGLNTDVMNAGQFKHLAKDNPDFIRTIFKDLTNAGGHTLGNESSIARMLQNAGQSLNPLGGKLTPKLEAWASRAGDKTPILKQIPNMLRRTLGHIAPTTAKGIGASAIAPALAWLLGKKYLSPHLNSDA